MHRNKKITLKVLLSFVSVLPLAGASTTVTLVNKPTVSVARITAASMAARVTAKLISYVFRKDLVALIVDYCRPNLIGFEITPGHFTTKLNGVTTHTLKGNRIPTTKSPKPFVSIPKLNQCCLACPRIKLGILYCSDTEHQCYKYWNFIVTDDGKMDPNSEDIFTNPNAVYNESQVRDSLGVLKWNELLPYTTYDPNTRKRTPCSKSCNIEIVDFDAAVGGGSTIVGRIYDTQDFVTWKALTQAFDETTEISSPDVLPPLSKPLPTMSDTSSSSSSSSASRSLKPLSPLPLLEPLPSSTLLPPLPHISSSLDGRDWGGLNSSSSSSSSSAPQPEVQSSVPQPKSPHHKKSTFECCTVQ